MHFLHALIFGRITFRRRRYINFAYDRCAYGGWDYYAFYLPFLTVMVSAPR